MFNYLCNGCIKPGWHNECECAPEILPRQFYVEPDAMSGISPV
jgi:hypothetical protein